MPHTSGGLCRSLDARIVVEVRGVVSRPVAEPVLTQDMHVYSTFSDGTKTGEENIAEAEQIGLTELAFVDHVRADTKWVPAYVAAVREGQEQTSIVLHCA